MNLTDTLKISVKYHLVIELLLLALVIFLLVKPSKDITFDTNGLVKNNLLNISLLADGTLVTGHPFADEATAISQEKHPNQSTLKELHNIVIAITEDGKDQEKAENTFLDSIISSAHATKHNLPGHVYRNITTIIDGSLSCKRYDVTLNWKYVGACM